MFKLIERIFQASAASKVELELSRYSDRELADIGINRGDIRRMVRGE